MLTNKHVVLGVTGSIAAYKAADLVSSLRKLHCDVTVIMTKNATNIIHPTTFETLSGRKCLTDTFDSNFTFEVEHISLAKKADLFMVAPASANVIGKIAGGIADDMLTTTIMACTCKKILAPAMNTNMYQNPIVQDNIARLKQFGYEFVTPATGHLACGDEGAGKLPDTETLLNYIIKELAYPKDMTGKNVLITAGPTRESLDPVRFITNHSTGKMGYALARHCMLRGANVTLVSGPVSLKPPMFTNFIPVVSASDMYEAVLSCADKQDIIIKAAAVADYTPLITANEKMKKSEDELQLSLKRTRDILKALGERKKAGQFLCGFSMETENMIENSKQKLLKKNADMIVANSLRQSGAGFGTDTNIVTFITKEAVKELPIMSKEEVAKAIINQILHDMNV